MRYKIFSLGIFLILTIQIMNAQNTDYIKMVEAAIKAPSGHNSQPWLFKLYEDKIDILPNMKEVLPIVDKSNRELFISLGAATENLCIAASGLGYQSNVNIDDSEKKITVHLKKYPDVAIDPLNESVAIRQTNRKVYSDKIIPDDTILVLNNLLLHPDINRYIISKNDSLFSILKSYVERGNQIQMQDKAFKEELLNYMRFNNNEVKNNPTGLSYKVMEAPAMPAVLSKFILKSYLKPNKQNKGDLKKIDSSSHLVLFTTQNNTLTEWINLGRNLQRFILTATQLGIANAYMNQSCEVDDLSVDIQKNVLDIKGEYPTLLLRIGYAERAPYSPRKSVDDVVVK